MRLLCLLMFGVLGCGMQSYPPVTKDASDVASELAMHRSRAADSDAAGQQPGAAKALPSSTALQRKIIYTAEIDLVVEQFDEVPSQVEALAKQFDGYVARSNIVGSPGSPRSGQWTIRVPVERYKEFLEAARQLGEVRRENVDSRDVSEEYYDLEARIRNKKKEEERLLNLLADATGKLEEILSVERELARVRGEIEQMEGRIRVLNDLTTLTTVTLSVDEIKNYVPEQAATYTTRLRRSFSKSSDALVSTAQSVSIAGIAALPWLGVLLVPVVLLVMLVRICRKRRRRAGEGGRG